MEQFNKSQRPKTMSNTLRNAVNSLAIGIGILSSGSAIPDKVDTVAKHPINYSEKDKNSEESKITTVEADKILEHSRKIEDNKELNIFSDNLAKYIILVEKINTQRKQLGVNSDYLEIVDYPGYQIDSVYSNTKLLLQLISGLRDEGNKFNTQLTSENYSEIFKRCLSLGSFGPMRYKQFNEVFSDLTKKENLQLFETMLENFFVSEDKRLESEREKKWTYKNYSEIV